MNLAKLSSMPSHVAIRKPEQGQVKHEDVRARNAKRRDVQRDSARRAKHEAWT